MFSTHPTPSNPSPFISQAAVFSPLNGVVLAESSIGCQSSIVRNAPLRLVDGESAYAIYKSRCHVFLIWMHRDHHQLPCVPRQIVEHVCEHRLDFCLAGEMRAHMSHDTDHVKDLLRCTSHVTSAFCISWTLAVLSSLNTPTSILFSEMASVSMKSVVRASLESTQKSDCPF